MCLIKKTTVARFRILIIALNCILASLSLINLYTVASGAIKVDIPEETDFAWTIDTKTEEASFFADFTVENRGVYDITDLDIHAQVTTESGSLLIDYWQEGLTIPSGELKKFDIRALMPFENIDFDEWKYLMVNDSVFFLDVDIAANYLWGLGRFIVDDTLEYAWEAPLNNISNKTDDNVVEFLKYIVTEKADINGIFNYISESITDNPIVSMYNWDNAEMRVESWPQGDNTSKMTVTLTLDVLGGRRTVIFEISFLLKMEGEEYEFTLEDFNFRYE
jgi:hypothetical protein